MSATQSAEFKKAVEDSTKLKAKPSSDELLSLYAYYKVSIGEDFASVPEPSSFNFKAKAKWSAWKKIAEQNITPEAAQAKYVELVTELKEKYGYDENKAPETVG